MDLRVDDHPRPIAELTRLYRDVHQYYFGATRQALPISPPLAREMRAALARLGFLRPAAGGAWDAASQQALEDFQGWENLEGRTRRDGTVDAVVLAHLRSLASKKARPARDR